MEHRLLYGCCSPTTKPQTQEAGNDLNSLIWVEEYLHEWKIQL
jgi:hypothetical protein